MNTVVTTGRESVCGTPHTGSGMRSRARFTEDSTVVDSAYVTVDDVASWIANHRTNYGIPASRQRLALAATLSVLEWDAVREAIECLVSWAVQSLAETIADCPLEDLDLDECERVYIEIGDFGDEISLRELLADANDYLPQIAEDILAHPA